MSNSYKLQYRCHFIVESLAHHYLVDAVEGLLNRPLLVVQHRLGKVPRRQRIYLRAGRVRSTRQVLAEHVKQRIGRIDVALHVVPLVKVVKVRKRGGLQVVFVCILVNGQLRRDVVVVVHKQLLDDFRLDRLAELAGTGKLLFDEAPGLGLHQLVSGTQFVHGQGVI